MIVASEDLALRRFAQPDALGTGQILDTRASQVERGNQAAIRHAAQAGRIGVDGLRVRRLVDDDELLGQGANGLSSPGSGRHQQCCQHCYQSTRGPLVTNDSCRAVPSRTKALSRFYPELRYRVPRT